MDAHGSLIPHPNFCLAGSHAALSEKSVEKYVNAFRPGAPHWTFSMMLGLLDTLRNLVLSGQEPAPFLIVLLEDSRPVLVAGGDPNIDVPRLRQRYGAITVAFHVSARLGPGGKWLEVSEPTGHTGYRLEQFCRRSAGRYEPLPYCWSRMSASSAYQSTSGLIPYFGFRNSSLLNHLIS